MKKALLIGILFVVACSKSDKSAGGGGGGGVTGGCLNETTGDCWEHPVGGNKETLGKICTNDPGAKWVDACPRDKLIGGCKSSNKYDKGAPTQFFYKGTVDEVKKTCTDGGQLFVEK